MRITVYSTKPYDRAFLTKAADNHDLQFVEARLDAVTAQLASGSDAVCVFVNDKVDADVVNRLAEHGVSLILLRCAGYNNVDVAAAARAGIKVARVPAYSPHAVAEHTLGLMLSLNRHIHRAHNRVRESNFALEGLLGFDMRGKTVGVIGTGAIGAVVCRIMIGLDCKVIASDPVPQPALADMGVKYMPVGEVFRESDIITLHCPLTPETFHLVSAEAIASMRPGVMLINTSRGALIDTPAVIEGLKSGQIGAVGLDVYEEEADLFFEDLSDRVIADDVFARLRTFHNVLVTGHQAFFTHEALTAIAETTMANASKFFETGDPHHAVTPEMVV